MAEHWASEEYDRLTHLFTISLCRLSVAAAVKAATAGLGAVRTYAQAGA
jgi:hypothetical protein